MNRRIAALVAALLLSGIGVQAGADAVTDRIRSHIDGKVKGWLADPVLLKAVKEQNARTAGFSQAKIDELDRQWRAEAKTGKGPLIDSVEASPASALLKQKQADSGGLYGELFVMDARGLNVAEAAPTSDYWQGDEAKFQKSFGVGANGLFVDAVEFDESAGAFFAQASVTLVDPAGRVPIGAITIGIRIEKLPD